MKTIYSFLFVVLAICYNAKAQVDSTATLNNSDSTLIKEVNGKVDSLDNKIDSLTKKVDDKVDHLTKTIDKLSKAFEADTSGKLYVGELIVYEFDKIPLYKDSLIPDSTVNIKEVRIEVKQGVIVHIEVRTEENINFSNGQAPIEIKKIGDKRCDYLRAEVSAGQINIKICDFLRCDEDEIYLCEKDKFTLTENESTKKLYRSTSLNSIINVRLYTDMLAALGDEGNGLVQTEADYLGVLHNSNFPNFNAYFFRYLTVNFQLSKFDSEFSTTFLNSEFSRKKLLQRSKIKTEVGISLISGFIEPKTNNLLSFDLIAGVNLSNVSEPADSSEKTVSLPYWGFKPSLMLMESDNFEFKVSLDYVWQYNPELDNEVYGSVMNVFTPQLYASWHPEKDPSNQIFARVKYSYIAQEKLPFWVFQFGYSLKLSELIKK